MAFLLLIGVAKIDKIDLFVPGMNGSKAYRIPALITTTKGTLIAANDARIVNQNDNPNKINITIRRSQDNGKSWTPVQTVVSFPGESEDSPAAIDSSLLQCEETQTIWMLYCHTPGGIGLWNSDKGTGFDEQKQRILYDNQMNKYLLTDKNTVKKMTGELTDYHVDETNYLYKENVRVGHIYQKFDPQASDLLVETPTSFLQLVKSDDDGETWSKPVDLNPQVKEEWMRFIGAGPGRGIQIKNGPHKGRLIFPIYFSNESRLLSCAVIYSDDNGATWKRGDSVNDNRKLADKKHAAESLGPGTNQYELTESQAFELSDGTIQLYMRNHSGKGIVARAISKDGGKSWEDFKFVKDLANPVCQFSVLSYPKGNEEWILFLGPDSKDKRENGVLKLSKDGGQTFQELRTIEPKSFVYSCLTITQENGIALLYETERGEGNLLKSVFTTLSIEEILNK